mmetsp:Transcript_18829/g.61229  ORF Transcript_18829/g.61229 Transcript_18829/m.61229 type:complete len:223 (+) Transcript_18829:743-1411(+)
MAVPPTRSETAVDSAAAGAAPATSATEAAPSAAPAPAEAPASGAARRVSGAVAVAAVALLPRASAAAAAAALAAAAAAAGPPRCWLPPWQPVGPRLRCGGGAIAGTWRLAGGLRRLPCVPPPAQHPPGRPALGARRWCPACGFLIRRMRRRRCTRGTTTAPSSTPWTTWSGCRTKAIPAPPSPRRRTTRRPASGSSAGRPCSRETPSACTSAEARSAFRRSP